MWISVAIFSESAQLLTTYIIFHFEMLPISKEPPTSNVINDQKVLIYQFFLYTICYILLNSRADIISLLNCIINVQIRNNVNPPSPLPPSSPQPANPK
jgi:hypothetical protein